MDLRHLRYFVAVAEFGTVSRAAERLNTTQPSLSRQIHDLENELGIDLFERVGRRLHLTGAGEEMLDKARRVLNEAEEFREHARSLGHGEVGVLRVGATPQSIERLFPETLQRFSRLKPGVTVRLLEGDSRSLSSRLREGELHLALTAYQAEWSDSARILGMAPLLAVARAPLRTEDGRIELRSLEHEPLLVFQRGFGSRDLLDAACEMAHIRPPIYLESASPRTLLELARAGRGVAIIPATVAPAEDGLHCHGLLQDGVVLEMRFAVHWNPKRYFPAYAELFLEELEKVARERFSSAPDGWAIRLVAG
ncbi:MAG: LysR family transcriptional regulator [Rhodovibrionaceae bacterium]|nr:LysR family transcriptional regulator [Rhodovibrionaceae bacterium]